MFYKPTNACKPFFNHFQEAQSPGLQSGILHVTCPKRHSAFTWSNLPVDITIPAWFGEGALYASPH